MSIFQDKTIIHISCEVIIIGTITYFFHTKTKKLLSQINENEKSIELLNNEMNSLKNQLIHTQSNVNELRNIVLFQRNVQTKSVEKPVFYPTQNEVQISQEVPVFKKMEPEIRQKNVQIMEIPEEELCFKKIEPVQSRKNVQIIEIVQNTDKKCAQIEVLDDLDKELEDELKELEIKDLDV